MCRNIETNPISSENNNNNNLSTTPIHNLLLTFYEYIVTIKTMEEKTKLKNLIYEKKISYLQSRINELEKREKLLIKIATTQSIFNNMIKYLFYSFSIVTILYMMY